MAKQKTFKEQNNENAKNPKNRISLEIIFAISLALYQQLKKHRKRPPGTKVEFSIFQNFKIRKADIFITTLN